MRARDERGSAVGQVAVAALCLSVAATVVVLVVQFASAARQASTAADLAALAGARALLDGGEPCRSAERVARANHATLVQCSVTWQTVEVRASVAVPWHPGGLPADVTARALAAPVP